MTELRIKYRDILECLHKGGFYRGLDSNEPDGVIEVPSDRYAAQTNLALNIDTFCQLVRVTMFWMLDEVPSDILEFCADNDINVWEPAILSIPGALESDFLTPLASVYKERGKRALAEAIKSKKWEIIMHCLKREKKDKSDAAGAAAFGGDLQLLQYLHDEGFAWNEDTCAAASLNGHKNCLEFAHKNGCPWNDRVYIGAALKGHLHIMEFAFKEKLELISPDICKIAADSGHLNCLQYAHSHRCPLSCDALRLSIESGHVDCLQFLLDHGCPMKSYFVADASYSHPCEIACRSGQLECLRVLLQFGVECNEFVSWFAAGYADASYLQLLRAFHCPWDFRTPFEAALRGSLASLQYAMEQGCDYGYDLLINAVVGGNVHCVQYLVEELLLNMDEEVYQAALLSGNLAIVQYLIDQGCPFQEANFYEDEEQVEEYGYYFVEGNVDFVRCVEYMVERGMHVSPAFVSYVRDRDTACMEYLLFERIVEQGTNTLSLVSSASDEDLQSSVAPEWNGSRVTTATYIAECEFDAALVCAAVEESLLR